MGKTLKKLRTAKKLSQAALAKRAGLSREYVNKIEAGRYDPPLSLGGHPKPASRRHPKTGQ
jgi:transcriptional regulator with XRE-family HTH domain